MSIKLTFRALALRLTKGKILFVEKKLLSNRMTELKTPLDPAALFKTRDRKKKCLLKSRQPEIKLV